MSERAGAPANPANYDVWEAGTGSGVVAIALAREIPGARIVASDVSAAALEVAVANARELGVAERIDFRAGDLLGALGAGERFDVVVANLPYIPSAEIDRLAAEVRSEPRSALDGGADGLALIRRLIAGVQEHLHAGGLVALEHGADQGPAVRQLLADAGFEMVATQPDLGGLDRVTSGRARTSG
jgi:release factor glutamine methyltransferase